MISPGWGFIIDTVGFEVSMDFSSSHDNRNKEKIAKKK